MAYDRSLVCTSMSASLCRQPPLPIVRSMVDGASSAIVHDELDAGAASEDASVRQSHHKVRACRFFLNGSNCRFGGGCRFLHSWWSGTDDLDLAMALQGHRKPITGIAVPQSVPKSLISSSIYTVKTWDLVSAQCVRRFVPGGRIGCSVGEGEWFLLGLPGAVKAWNLKTGVELSLDFPGGKQVYALVMGSVDGDELLFAGLSDGTIETWMWNVAANTFQRLGMRAASLIFGHIRAAIRALVVGNGMLYSGSMDHTIKVWNLRTLNCIQTLKDHRDAVTSIICWEKYMISGSLDGTVRVWSLNASRELESIYMHKQEGSVVALGGMYDSRCRPVLMCSCDDFSVYFYDLPSFVEVGCIFSADEVRHITTGQNGLFFTGNASGELKMWKWKTGN